MNLKFCFSISFGLCFHIIIAQANIEGKIQDYHGGAAEVILPAQDPKIIGKITENGYFMIDLEDEMAKEVSEAMDKANEKSESIRIINNSVSRAFYCDSDDVVVINGEEIIESVTIQGMFFIGILNEKKAIGKLSLASSKEFTDSFFSLGKKDFVTGYYIDFYYVDEVASVKGVCKTKSYTLDMKDTFQLTHDYNIDLKKGWNIVKIGVAEVYEDQEGHIRPLIFQMTTLDELPKDVKFIFTPGNKL